MIRALMEIPMKTSNTVCMHTVMSLVATGLLAWGGAAPVAAADSPDAVHTKQVSLSDLDLSTVAGQASAHERLLDMAHRLCTEVEDLDDLSHHANFLKCMEAATASTGPHLDAMIRRATEIRTASVAQIQR
jgi:UrcA family protein